MPVTVTCLQCGKQRVTYPSWAKGKRGKFCSMKCFGKWNSKHRTGENSHSWRGGMPIRFCEICGKEYHSRRKKARFCSSKCLGKHLNNLYKTKHHVTFKGGHAVRQRVYWEKFPEKKRAWLMVQWALKTGRLVKGPCEFCGTRRKVVGHHDDYAKPLDVRWMCVTDHTKYHVKKAREAGGHWPAWNTNPGRGGRKKNG